MCGLILDVVVLLFVVKVILNEDMELFQAVATILAASLVGWLVQFGLGSVLGTESTGSLILIGAVSAAAVALVIGAMLSLFLGDSLKRACIAAAAFFGIRIVIAVVFILLFSAVGGAG